MEIVNNQKGCGAGMSKIKGMSELRRGLKQFPNNVEKIIKDTLLEWAQKIYNDAMAGLPAGATAIKATYRIETSRGGWTVKIVTENEIAAYIEFGTGSFAANYLAGQPKEVSDDAIKFFVNGEGTMPARPYLFPAYYKNREAFIVDLNKKFERLVKQIA